MIGVIDRIQAHVQIRCLPQIPETPEAKCLPDQNALIIISPAGSVGPTDQRSVFVYQSAAVTGRITGNFTPQFDSEITGRIFATARQDQVRGTKSRAVLELNTAHRSIILTTVPAEPNQGVPDGLTWRFDKGNSTDYYRAKFDLTEGNAPMAVPLQSTSLHFTLGESLFMGSGTIDLKIER